MASDGDAPGDHSGRRYGRDVQGRLIRLGPDVQSDLDRMRAFERPAS
jgi:hypothetical protein